jgi:propane monooxygenase small subunit
MTTTDERTADSPAPERSSPRPEFTDAEAGAKEFPDSNARNYNYFVPA